MNSIFLGVCVLTVFLAALDVTGSSRFRYRRQDDAESTPAPAIEKCSKCGGTCDTPAEMDCGKETIKDLKIDGPSEADTTLLTLAQEITPEGTALEVCVTMKVEGGSLRSCAPKKVDDKEFCDTVKEKNPNVTCEVCSTASLCNKPESTKSNTSSDENTTPGSTAVKISLNYSTFCFIISAFLIHMIL